MLSILGATALCHKPGMQVRRLLVPPLAFVSSFILPPSALIHLARHFIADKSQRLLDFGWCTLRMNFGTEN